MRGRGCLQDAWHDARGAARRPSIAMSESTAPPVDCHHCPLRRLPIFKPAAPGEIDFILERKRGQRIVAEGGTVIAEGEKADRIYTVLSGWAFRFKTLPDGRRQILNFLLPGDIVGIQAELPGPSSHGVDALTTLSLCAFARQTVWEVFQTFPTLALDLTWLAAHEERLVDDITLSVGRRTALERMAALLVRLYKRAASVGLETDKAIALPLTQAHIADALGLSIVHTNRTLQALRRRGLVRIENGRLSIGDLRALRAVGQYWEQPAPPRPLF